MICVRCYCDGSHHHLHISGHAGYAPRGQDIVCAGVSAISMALLEYLRQTGETDAAWSSGELKLRCRKGERTDCAFAMALAGYLRIAETYPRYAEVDITPSEKGAERKCTEYAQNQHHRDGL